MSFWTPRFAGGTDGFASVDPRMDRNADSGKTRLLTRTAMVMGFEHEDKFSFRQQPP
jgi:hypothetical protein